MNYQTISNLEFRPLLIFFHRNRNDFRDMGVEIISFGSASIGQLTQMIRKTFNIHLNRKRRYKMVASKQVEFRFCRFIGC